MTCPTAALGSVRATLGNKLAAMIVASVCAMHPYGPYTGACTIAQMGSKKYAKKVNVVKMQKAN